MYRNLPLVLLTLGILVACGGGADTPENITNTPAGSTDTPIEDDTTGTPSEDDNDSTPPTDDTPDTPPTDGGTTEDEEPSLSDAVLSADEFSKRIVEEGFDISGVLPNGGAGYQSSDETVATVMANGWVNVLQPGEVTISNDINSGKTIQTSQQQKTDNPQSTVQLATVDIISKPSNFNFKAWIGENDTTLDFNESLYGLTLFTGGGRHCDPITEENCVALESQIITNSDISDQASTLSNPAFYQFTFGENKAGSSVLSAEKFEVRSSEATIVFNNQLFLIGGYTTGDVNNAREYMNDVWVSKDGNEWLELAEQAEFPARTGHQLIVHNQQLWLIGGSTNRDIHNDVWVSDDGISWSEVDQTAPYAKRTHFDIFSLNGAIFISGGYTTNGEKLSDLWYSADGKSWAQVPNFNLAEADNSPVVVLGEGEAQTAYLLGDKTYSSSDGTIWTEIDSAPIFTGFDNREAALVNDEIWLFTYTFEYFGSRGSKNISRVYKSTDAINWTMVTGGIYLGNLVAREAKPIEFNERLYIVGGRAEILEYTNEVWSTTDAELWLEHTTGGLYGPRYSHAMTSHNGMLYSTGGVASDNVSTATPYKADVWKSVDGLNWTLVEDGHPTFRPRGGHALLSAGDKLCYVGGQGRLVWGTASGYRDPFTVQNPDPAGSVLHVILFERYGVFGDIACSVDGGTVWHEVVPNTDDYFDARTGAAYVYFNNKIWVIGGNFNSTYFADVWSSASVDTWEDRRDQFTFGAYFTQFTEVANQAAFSPRTGHAVTIHNGELYLSAGKNADGFYLDDLWKSADGETWTLVNADMGTMDKRAYHQMVSFNNKLWIIAGRANYHETLVFEDTTVYEANDIWVSADNGLTWTEVAEHANFEQRQEFQAVVHNNSLYISGGTGGDGYVTVQGKDSILSDVWRSEDGINWRTGFYKELTLSK